MSNGVLFALPALIWGSTWLAIRFQLGVVDPLASVAYRFLAASAILLLYCAFKGVDLRLAPRDHLFVSLQGVLLFGLNYWLVYLAELELPSGLVALAFSGLLFANVLNARVFLATPVRRPVLLGGLLGVSGLGLIFAEEVAGFSLSDRSLQALCLALASVYSASLGNILSGRNQRAGLSVLQTNSYGMLYGGLSMLILAVALGTPIRFDWSWHYLASLAYLTVFGSIVAFAAFLTLLGRIGAGRAAYVALVMPVIALLLTTLFEGYAWTPASMSGVALILSGNYLALRR